MTIIEALKSGKNFKREGDYQWYTTTPGPNNIGLLTPFAVLQDDWIVEPEPKPKWKALINIARGTLLFFNREHLENPDWKRAPWLDEP